MKIHRQIRIIPVAGDPHSFELFPLNIHPAFRKPAAFLTELHNIDRVFIAPFRAVLFLDLPFDGQTVAIPPWDISRVKPHHLLGAHHHILQRFVQRMTDMKMAIGIGRSIMQDKRCASRFLPQLLINIGIQPALQPTRFPLRQSGTHGKIGLWKVQGVLVIGCRSIHGNLFYRSVYAVDQLFRVSFMWPLRQKPGSFPVKERLMDCG